MLLRLDDQPDNVLERLVLGVQGGVDGVEPLDVERQGQELRHDAVVGDQRAQARVHLVESLDFVTISRLENDVVRDAVVEEGARDPEGEGQVARHTLALPHHEAAQGLTLQHLQCHLPATDLEVIVGNVDFELALCVSDSDWVELDCGLGNLPSDCSLGDITWGCRVTEIIPGGCGGGLSNSLAGSLAWNSVFLSPKPWHS